MILSKVSSRYRPPLVAASRFGPRYWVQYGNLRPKAQLVSLLYRPVPGVHRLKPVLLHGAQTGSASGTPTPPPCFCHEYQNKGVTDALYAKNIILKDLAIY